MSGKINSPTLGEIEVLRIWSNSNTGTKIVEISGGEIMKPILDVAEAQGLEPVETLYWRVYPQPEGVATAQDICKAIEYPEYRLQALTWRKAMGTEKTIAMIVKVLAVRQRILQSVGVWSK